MSHKIKSRKQNIATLGGVAVGVAVCLVAWFLLSAGTALLIINENISEASIHWLIPIMQLIISFAGAFIAGRIVGEKKAIASIACALGYLALLIAASLLVFDNRLFAVAPIIIAISVGVILSVVLNLFIEARPAQRKRARYH